MRRSALVILIVMVTLAREGFARRLSPSSSRIVASRLRGGVELPPRGDGYLVPLTWRLRGLSFGVPRLVALIQRAAARVSERIPGATLYVADLSAPLGGPTSWHHSHRSGHDADLLFYALDQGGQPLPPPIHMIRFEPPGLAWTEDQDGEPARVELDDAR